MTHTSGIPDYEVLNFPIPTAIRVDFPARQIIDSLMKLPPDFPPGYISMTQVFGAGALVSTWRNCTNGIRLCLRASW